MGFSTGNASACVFLLVCVRRRDCDCVHGSDAKLLFLSV